MTAPLRILMVSSEVASLARTGGLGDAVEALAFELAALGADVVVVTPRYGVTRTPAGAKWWPEPVVAPLGLGHARTLGVLDARLVRGARPGPRACLVADAGLFDRAGIYGDAAGTFGDNAFRFAALSSGALAVAERVWPDARPDVVHAHDWHAAPAVIYARLGRGPSWESVPTVFTIHNLAYQGVFGPEELDYLAIPRQAWSRGWVRHGGRVNLMKGAIELADRVTTVSETYAREIQTPAGGHGLEMHLRWHAGKLVGIVNGIDTASFDPRTDPAIARRYGPDDALEGKRACKSALCAELGLEGGPDAPLFALVSRLDWLKGVDLLLAAAPQLVSRGARLALAGSGDASLEHALREAQSRWPGRVSARVAFDPALARRFFSGADFLVVPSREEPCGLTQLYAMRYGAVPVVTPVGGLRDTVDPLDPTANAGTGLVASGVDRAALLSACERALAVWGRPAAMASLVRRAMARDSSWSKGARRYMDLFGGLAPARG